MRTSMSHGMQVLCRLMHVVCSSAERLRFCKAAAGAHLKSSALYLLLGIPAVILVLGFIAYLTLPYHISAGIWASVFDNNSVVVLESNLAADGSNILILKDINAGGGV